MIDTAPHPVIETKRLNDDEAAKLEKQLGCLVVKLSVDGSKPMTPPVRVEDHNEACRLAAYLKAQDPEREFAVYRPTRVYGHADPEEVPA